MEQRRDLAICEEPELPTWFDRLCYTYNSQICVEIIYIHHGAVAAICGGPIERNRRIMWSGRNKHLKEKLRHTAPPRNAGEEELLESKMHSFKRK